MADHAHITRRHALKLLPGGLAAAGVPAVAIATDLGPTLAAENPDLIAAYDRLQAARDEVTAAQDALEWIADEYRHLWPLAPEELLQGSNGDRMPADSKFRIERDILGRPLIRDTSSLTKRFSAAQRRDTPKACFIMMTEAEARQNLAIWQDRPAQGRTAKSLARNTAWRAEYIRKTEQQIILARAYEAETKLLREVAGINAAKARIEDAKAAERRIAVEISHLPAYTLAGLRLRVLAVSPIWMQLMTMGDDAFGPTARLMKSILDMTEGEA